MRLSRGTRVAATGWVHAKRRCCRWRSRRDVCIVAQRCWLSAVEHQLRLRFEHMHDSCSFGLKSLHINLPGLRGPLPRRCRAPSALPSRTRWISITPPPRGCVSDLRKPMAARSRTPEPLNPLARSAAREGTSAMRVGSRNTRY
jgi:hypothetical protein